ncbi:MAG: ATP-binding cassette domain-containing protein [Candidatus Korarchaeum sp.]|nr:ATP-binding cassette domain-containing protein [Candidatus Korarchaeum sp.]MDW8035187.1 ATP-binding cassette domain-containing protein [Candidatus Korarchaeum sp.]
MSSRDEVVRLEDVWVSYSGSERPAIRGISLSLSSGESALITGPNGAGKTTLVETCLGLLKPVRGDAFLLGVNTKSRKISEVRKLCSYVPQDFMKSQEESYTVKHVISMGLAPLKSPFRAISVELEEDIKRTSTLLGIRDLLSEPFGRLSGGQQQRVIIARALVRRPKLLFMDEPFSSLDLEAKSFLSETLKDYVSREKATLVVVSHDPNALQGFDRVLRMECGSLVS